MKIGKKVIINKDKLIFLNIEINIREVDGYLYDTNHNKIYINNNNVYIIGEYATHLLIASPQDELFDVTFETKYFKRVIEYRYSITTSNVNRLEHAIVTTSGGKRIERVIYPNKVIKNLDYFYGNDLDLVNFYENL